MKTIFTHMWQQQQHFYSKNSTTLSYIGFHYTKKRAHLMWNEFSQNFIASLHSPLHSRFGYFAISIEKNVLQLSADSSLLNEIFKIILQCLFLVVGCRALSHSLVSDSSTALDGSTKHETRRKVGRKRVEKKINSKHNSVCDNYNWKIFQLMKSWSGNSFPFQSPKLSIVENWV